MKLLLLLAALAAPIHAEEGAQVFPLPLFKDGLYTRYSANAIPDGALSEALNVLIDQDVDGVVVARNGYAKYNTSAITDTKTVRGLWAFDASDGTKYMVAFSSMSFYKTSGDATWTQITGLTGFSATKDFDCVQTIGKLFCGNGDAVFSWDGTSTATVTGAPLGNLLGRFRNRLLIAGVSGSKARLRGSGELDATDWTLQIPGVSTTPFNLAFGGADDGEDITCLMGAFQDVFIVGKRQSLWGLYGFGRTDFQIRELSREVGCIEQRSVREKNNCLYWMSQRGIEKFCGAAIERIGDPIRDNIDNIVAAAGNARSALDTTQSDFEAGNLTFSGAGAPMSATIQINAVVPTTWTRTANGFGADWAMVDLDSTVYSNTFVDNFDDGNITGGDFVWTNSSGNVYVDANYTMSFSTNKVGGASYASTPISFSSGIWSFVFNSSATSLGGEGFIYYFVSNNPHMSLTEGYRTYAAQGNNSGAVTNIALDVTHNGGNTQLQALEISPTLFDGQNHTWVITRSTTGYMSVIIDGVKRLSGTSNAATGSGYSLIYGMDSGNLDAVDDSSRLHLDNFKFPNFYQYQTSTAYDTVFATTTYGDYQVTMTSSSLSSATFRTETSDSLASGWSGLATVTNGGRIPSTDDRRYIRHSVSVWPPESSSVNIASITAITLTAATTGYFGSQCRNTTGVSEWGLLSCNMTQSGGGTITLAVATGTTCNMATRSTATYTTISNNTTISVATAAYISYRALFSINSATQANANNLSLLDCTINWNEGASRPPVASQVYRDRYYLAYTSSTASGSHNDHLLVLDKNDKWTLFDNHPCYSMVFYNRKLYCGSSTNAGQVWLLDQGTDDDGTAILAKMRTKAFNFGMPESRKRYRKLYLDLEPSPSQAITLTGRYTLERSSTTYSLNTVDLNEDPGSILTTKFPFPLTNPVAGRYIQLELESSGLNSPWRLFGGRLYYSPLDPE